MSKKVIEVTYNWFQRGNNNDGMGEDYYIARIGQANHPLKLMVKDIIEHIPQGEGDRLYYDIIFDDDSELRVFNPNTVIRNKSLKASENLGGEVGK